MLNNIASASAFVKVNAAKRQATDALGDVVSVCGNYARSVSSFQNSLLLQNQALRMRLAAYEAKEGDGAAQGCVNCVGLRQELETAMADDQDKWAVVAALMDRLGALRPTVPGCGGCVAKARAAIELEARVRDLGEKLKHQTHIASIITQRVNGNAKHATDAELVAGARGGKCMCQEPGFYAVMQLQVAVGEKNDADVRIQQLLRRVSWLERIVASVQKEAGREIVSDAVWMPPEDMVCLRCEERDGKIETLERELEVHKSAEHFRL
jgi:hypothetical protein